MESCLIEFSDTVTRIWPRWFSEETWFYAERPIEQPPGAPAGIIGSAVASALNDALRMKKGPYAGICLSNSPFPTLGLTLVGSAVLAIRAVRGGVEVAALDMTQGRGFAEKDVAVESVARSAVIIEEAILRLISKCQRFQARAPSQTMPAPKRNPELPISFGFKATWVAVKTDDPARVAISLEFGNTKKCTWEEGVEKGYSGEAYFLSPPIGGWVLVLGEWRGLDDKSLRSQLERLSEQFGEVQYFGTHRVVEYHAWGRFARGRMIRAYSYLGERGEVLLDVGEKTTDELDVLDENAIPNEQTVMDIAAAWSVDPSMLAERTDLRGSGLIAETVHRLWETGQSLRL
jgi:hypothetical protein